MPPQMLPSMQLQMLPSMQLQMLPSMQQIPPSMQQMTPQMQQMQQMQQINKMRNVLTANKAESILFKETDQGTISKQGVLVKIPTGINDFCFFSNEGMFFTTIEYKDDYKYITHQRELRFQDLMLAYNYNSENMPQP